MRSAGVDPLVKVSGVDEDAALHDAEARYGPLEPADIALVLARAKAESVAAALAAEALGSAVDRRRPGSLLGVAQVDDREHAHDDH